MKSLEEKAKELGVPFIPKVEKPWFKEKPYETNPTIAICGECGIEIKRIMGYCCRNHNCPCGMGPILCGANK